MRRRGKSALRVCYQWAVPVTGEQVMHLFWSLTNQPMGKSMCGRVVYSDPSQIHQAAFGNPVCPRCREISLPGHPLPRGMA